MNHEILKIFIENKIKRDEYLNRMSELDERLVLFIVDNFLTENLEKKFLTLMNLFFTEEFIDIFFIFMKEEKPIEFGVDHLIENFDDLMNFIDLSGIKIWNDLTDEKFLGCFQKYEQLDIEMNDFLDKIEQCENLTNIEYYINPYSKLVDDDLKAFEVFFKCQATLHGVME